MQDKVVLITGGSRGIGAATARLAASQGWRVCINYRKAHEEAENLVSEITREGGNAFSIAADISNEEEVERLFEAAFKQYGRLDALVNNAGIIDRQAKLVDMRGARLQRMFNTNILGSFLCAREAIKRMSIQQQGAGGGIVNLSSSASRLGSPGEFIDYAASKGAIDTMTIGLSKEVAEAGIRVNAVRPGLIDTDIHQDAGDVNRPEKLRHAIPMKRPGSAQEVASTIMWLLSDEASYITGALIDVSGGR